jgi:uncharacterized membrane protein
MRSLEYFGEWMFHAAASSRSRFWLKDSMFIGVPGLAFHSLAISFTTGYPDVIYTPHLTAVSCMPNNARQFQLLVFTFQCAVLAALWMSREGLAKGSLIQQQ